MKLSVIGTFTRDTTLPLHGKQTESYGGLTFTVMMLSFFLADNDEIHPVCNVGYDIYEGIQKHLSGLNNIVFTGMQKVVEKNNHVLLKYTSEEERKEILSHGVPPLSFDQIRSFLDTDLLVVNFISGFELSLETMVQIRQDTPCRIYMDIHSLTLGRNENGERFLRPIPNWEQWVKQVDLIQMNNIEADLLMESTNKTFTGFYDFADYIFSLGPEIFLLTFASKGSRIFYRKKGNLIDKHIMPYYTDKMIDPTGCGDVYAAGFISTYIKDNHDAHHAAKFASYVAGLSGTIGGADKFIKFPHLIHENPFSV